QRVTRKPFAGGDNQDSWHEVENALSVPFADPPLRLRLIKASQDIALELEKGAAPGAGRPGLSPKQAEGEARAAAQLQGRLALAALGEGWEDHKEVDHMVRRPEEGAWYRSLGRAGERVGAALNRIPEQAQKKTEEASAADLGKAAALLRDAARLDRELAGYMPRPRYHKADRGGERRRPQVHDLLCWQAHRAFLDYWAAEAPGRPHYYRAAGDVFVKDAEGLVAGKAGGPKGPRLAKVEEAR